MMQETKEMLSTCKVVVPLQELLHWSGQRKRNSPDRVLGAVRRDDEIQEFDIHDETNFV